MSMKSQTIPHGTHYQKQEAFSEELLLVTAEFVHQARAICEKMNEDVKAISSAVMRASGAYEVPFPYSFQKQEAFGFLVTHSADIAFQMEELKQSLFKARRKFLFFAALADFIEAKEAEHAEIVAQVEAKREARAAKERARRAAKKAQGVCHD